MSSQQVIIETLLDIKDDIVSSINALGLRASGLSSRTAEVRKKGKTGGILILEGYTFFLFDQEGRAPGKFPPVDQIRDWIQSKGISFDGFSIDQMTFLVGRSIARRGTQIFRGKQGIPLDKIIDKNLEDNRESLEVELREEAILEVNKQVIELNKDLATEAL